MGSENINNKNVISRLDRLLQLIFEDHVLGLHAHLYSISKPKTDTG